MNLTSMNPTPRLMMVSKVFGSVWKRKKHDFGVVMGWGVSMGLVLSLSCSIHCITSVIHISYDVCIIPECSYSKRSCVFFFINVLFYTGEGGDGKQYSKNDCLRLAKTLTDMTQIPVSCKEVVNNEQKMRKAW